MGPVQEKDTNTRVKAMKRILINPAVESALASILVDHDEGKVISKAPKNDIANTTRSPKKIRLKMALVDKLFIALAPKISVISMPRKT